MDKLVGQLVTKAGIERAVAQKAVGIILGFLRSEGPSAKDQMGEVISQTPGLRQFA